MSARSPRQKRVEKDGPAPTSNVQGRTAPFTEDGTAEHCRLLTACLLRGIHDALTGPVERRDETARLASFRTPWGRAHTRFQNQVVGNWSPALHLAFLRTLRARGSQAWEHIEGIIRTGNGAKRVPAFVRYFVPGASRELRLFVLHRVQVFLVDRNLATTREAVAKQHIDQVTTYLGEHGLPLEAVFLTKDGVNVSLEKTFRAAGVTFITARRHGDLSSLARAADAAARTMRVSSGNLLFVPTQYRSKGKDASPGILFDFGELGVKRGGILDQILLRFDIPSSHMRLGVIERVVRHAAGDKTYTDAVTGSVARRILGTSVADVTDQDVLCLVRRVQSDAEARNLSPRSIGHYIGVLRTELQIALSAVGRVMPRERVGKFVRPPGPGRGLISDLPDAGAPEELRAGIVHVANGSPEEALEKAKTHLGARLNRIDAACDKEIFGFAAWRQYILDAAAAALSSERLLYRDSLYGSSPAAPSRAAMAWLAGGELSQVLGAIADAASMRRLDTYEGERARRDEDRIIVVGPASSRLLQAFPGLERWCDTRHRGRPQTSLIQSRWFVPRAVQLAIEIKLQIATGWNHHTAVALEAAGVRFAGSVLELQALKNKTGEMQDSVIEGADPGLRLGLKMMLDQDEVLSHWPRNNRRLFVTVCYTRKKGIYIERQIDTDLLAAFQDRHGLPRFGFDQLRNQVGAKTYLRRQDPHEVQALLGHASLETTSGYIRHRVIAVLNEANVAHFRRQLAATIVWASGGDHAVEARGLGIDNVRKRLLFPVGADKPAVEPQADCDAWLAQPDQALIVDASRVNHLVRQRRYYAQNWQRLRASNSEQFERVHLPRIEFTAALWAVIQDSPLAGLLEQLQ